MSTKQAPGPEWVEPKEIDQQKRMKNYMAILSADSWTQARKILLSRSERFYFALAINDMPESYRIKTIVYLREFYSGTVSKIIAAIQLNRSNNQCTYMKTSYGRIVGNIFYILAASRIVWVQMKTHFMGPASATAGATRARQTSKSWLARIPRDSDLAGLRSIPEELLDMIKQFSPHAYLWRVVSILALTPRPISAPLPQTLALDSIESWQRGDREVAGLGDERPIIRITIDPHGIQAIERLPELPKVTSESFRHRLYIVEDLATLAGIQACI
ncbi:hypothetical protein F5883DRAFT_636918 [Diaporthe sp. PMI_573]|nr:hypothetical protein F5883DRAFT_636918 [Diaporthaceae sp. PMI_573]